MTAIIRYQNSCRIAEEDDEEILGALDTELSFKLLGAEFSQAYKGYTNDLGEFVTWDGKRHLLSPSGKFPVGLLPRVMDFYAAKRIHPMIIDERPPIEKSTPLDISNNLRAIGKEARPYQESAANAAVGTDRGIIRLATGGGKCSSVDSLHITEHGLLNYTELLGDGIINDGEAIEFVCEVSSVNSKSRTDISSMIYNDGYGKSIKITTSYGYELIATHEHKIQVLESNGSVEWKKVSDLKVDDYAIICSNTYLFGKNYLPLDEAYWYGLLIGDGSMTLRSRVELINQDEHIIEFAHTYAQTHGLPLHCRTEKNTKAVRMRIFDTKYRKYLEQHIGFGYQKSTNKTLPQQLRRLSKESLAMVIRGMFETDGWVDKTNPIIGIGLANKDLINQLQLILLNFGIVSSVSLKHDIRKDSYADYYVLIIFRDFINKFQSEIGFDPNGYKYKTLHRIISKYTSKQISKKNIVPYQGSKIKRLYQIGVRIYGSSKCLFSNSEFSYSRIRRWISGNVLPSVFVLKNFIIWYKGIIDDIEANEVLRDLEVLCSNLFFDKISTIKNTHSYNYDFVIPDTHSFVSQGFSNHNTLISALITGKIGKSATILVIGKDLLYQTQSFFKEVFRQDIGIVGDGQCDIRDINIATIWSVGQALGLTGTVTLDDDGLVEKKTDPEKFSKIKGMLLNSGTIILDECHLAACDTVQVIARNIKAEYVYGMSASPWRDDGADMLIEAFLGRKIVDVSARELIKQGYLVPPHIRFIAPTPYQFKSGKYPSIYSKYIVENDQRNSMIVKATKSMVEQGFVPLVLFHTIKHGDVLFDHMKKTVPTGLLSGKDSAKQREKIKDELESGKIKCLVASKIFDIGVDLPILSGLVIAGAGKSSVRALQRIGRVIRPYKGKKMSAIIDFADQAPYLNQHAEIRREIYESEFDVTWPQEKKQ